MTCDEARARMPGYPAGEGADGERVALLLHTVGCAECRSELVAVLAAAERVRAAVAAVPGPPPELREAVLWAVLRPEERRREIARRALAAVLPPVAAMGLDPRWVVPRWARRGRRV